MARYYLLGAFVTSNRLPKDKHLGNVRIFFHDCQEWEWIPRRFDPYRALATPRNVRSLIHPDPRVIADDVWAKLLWAGINFQESDARGRITCHRARSTIASQLYNAKEPMSLFELQE